MIVALILLVLLTIIGVTAINTSTTETMISSADEVKRTAFYAAESGVEHATVLLKSQFVKQNQIVIHAALAGGGGAPEPQWDFALNGGNDVTTVTAGSPTETGWVKRFDAGAPWIVDAPLGNGYTYNVRVWDNADTSDGSANPELVDTDGLIVVGAIATGPRNTRAAVEVVLRGAMGTASSSAYTAQAGGGSGKNYNAADVGAISAANLGAMSSSANLK